MTRGKTIQIYLPDGNPKGIKICEVPNSIVKAVLIPRNLLNDAKDKENLNKVGIYFLFSDKDETFHFETYIGEAENLLTRLKQHDSKKDGWNYVVCFISSKNNLNKAHIKFLESYCYKHALEINRTKVTNSCTPTESNLTNQDKDFALIFFDDMKLILGTLGYPIFEQIKKAQTEEGVFYCKKKNAQARGNLTEGGFVVYKGSLANLETRPSSSQTVIKKREGLVNRGILIKNGKDTYTFSKDFEFNSPSIAAASVIGGNANGWKEWKNKTGETIDEL